MALTLEGLMEHIVKLQRDATLTRSELADTRSELADTRSALAHTRSALDGLFGDHRWAVEMLNLHKSIIKQVATSTYNGNEPAAVAHNIAVMMANGGTPDAAALMPAAAAPMPAAAMAGGGAPMPAAAAPMPAAAMAGGGAPMPGGGAPITTLKITLLKDVNLQTFLPELDGELSRSKLIGANKDGPKPSRGFICVNFASTEQATSAYGMLSYLLRDLADPAYKVGYKQAK